MWIALVVEACVIAGLLVVLGFMLRIQERIQDQGVKERAMLQDRIMVLTDPSAFAVKKAYEDPQPGSISYVGEEPGTSITRESLHA